MPTSHILIAKPIFTQFDFQGKVPTTLMTRKVGSKGIGTYFHFDVSLGPSKEQSKTNGLSLRPPQ